MFNPETGEPTALVHAGEVTSIRTGAASAAATNAMARHDAERLTVVGYGEQAASHVLAISKVRALKQVIITGRNIDKAQALADTLRGRTGLDLKASDDIRASVEQADIICTVTASQTPVVKGAWVSPGAHINIVGSSYAGPVEVDEDLVAQSYFVADHREGVLAQGAEFLNTRRPGASVTPMWLGKSARSMTASSAAVLTAIRSPPTNRSAISSRTWCVVAISK